MKKVFILVVVALVALSAEKASAQSFKFGHINMNEVYQAMPETDSARNKLEVYAKELREIIQEMQNDYQKKATDFEEKQAGWSDAVRNAKQRELADIYRRLQEQGQTAEEELAAEQSRLFTPIANKAQEALNKVAKNNGYTYIFDLASNAVLYFNESQSTNILPLVKTELKIK